MKTLFLIITITCVGLAAAPINTSAQQDQNIFAYNATNAAFTAREEKKEFSVTGADNVNVKALKDFGRSFKNVTNQTWYQVAKGGFIAQFLENGIDTRVIYNEKGRWQYNLLTYTEEYLPFEIRDMVKRTYYDYEILIVNEYQITDVDKVYVIKMEDKTHLITLKITGDDVKVIESFIRG